MKKKEVTIKDLAELLLPKLWIVVIVSILFAGLTFVYSKFFKVDTYTSSSKLYVNSAVSTGNDVTTGDNIIVARYMLDNYKIILKSEKFLNMVIDDLNTNDDYADYKDITKGLSAAKINSMLSISHYEDSEVFSISITSIDPELACVISKAIHNNAVDNIGKIVPSAKVFALSSIQDPIEPEAYEKVAKNSNHEFRNTLLAFLIGTVLSVVAIWVFSFFDVVIRDKKNLADNIDVPILGVIPRHDLQTITKGENKNA